MKTPMQELIETFEEMRSPIDSKVDVDFAISLVKSMLEKEKEVMCEFAFRFNHDAFTENYIKAEFEENFNTEECTFYPTMNTSSATICGACGKEKFEHKDVK